MGPVFGIPDQALHAARRPVDLAANASTTRGPRIPRSRTAIGKGHTEGRVSRAGTGRGLVACHGPARGGALHVSRTRTSQQLLLRLHATDLAARGDGEGTVSEGGEVRPEEIS